MKKEKPLSSDCSVRKRSLSRQESKAGLERSTKVDKEKEKPASTKDRLVEEEKSEKGRVSFFPSLSGG